MGYSAQSQAECNKVVNNFGYSILNIKGIVNPDKAEILAALVKYENSSADIVDCMLAARSSPQRVIVSFDKDFNRLKAICEKLWVIAVNRIVKVKIDVPSNESILFSG